jgi:hypothetical protein
MVIFLFTVYFSENNYRIIAKGEQGIVEIATAFLYLFSVVAAIYFRSKEKQGSTRWFLGLWLILSLLFLGEETSWGQHVLSYSAPQFFQDFNSQNEANIHNLIWFQGGRWLEFGSDTTLTEVLFFVSEYLSRRVCFLLPLSTRTSAY